MLIEFTVGNYRSFRGKETLSMVATPLQARDPAVDARSTVMLDDGTSILNMAVVYGANASGKSNLIDAVTFATAFVLGSAREGQAHDAIDVSPFLLSPATGKKPSHFEFVFITQGIRYRYGFEVTRSEVTQEWLYYVPSKRETKLFRRKGQQVSMTKVFAEGEGLESKTRKNALFLSVAAQFNGKMATDVLAWFKTVRIASEANTVQRKRFSAELCKNNDIRQAFAGLLNSFDTGIADIKVLRTDFTADDLPRDMPPELKTTLAKYGQERLEMRTLHRTFDEKGEPVGLVEFGLEEHESDGTRKLFALLGPILQTLVAGDMLFVDELDARLHPILGQKIVEMVGNPEMNSKNAQVVFTTHETSLMSNKRFRRDQIWFTEKNKRGESILYSMAEFKVRNDASFEKDYIKGRFGGVPFVGPITFAESEEA